MKSLPGWFLKKMDQDINDMSKEWQTTFDEAETKILKVAYLKGFKFGTHHGKLD